MNVSDASAAHAGKAYNIVDDKKDGAVIAIADAVAVADGSKKSTSLITSTPLSTALRHPSPQMSPQHTPLTSPHHKSLSSTTLIPFVTGNPAVETIRGTLISDVSMTTYSITNDDDEKKSAPSRLVYWADVPNYMSVTDVYSFLSDHLRHITQCAIVHTNNAQSTYIAIFCFDTGAAAEHFVAEMNGQPLHGAFDHTDTASIHMMSAVSYDLITPSSTPHSFPYAIPSHASLSVEGTDEQSLLPICPVCLDVIDPASSALITILCQHHFHFHCLSQWTDSTCPVCRYVITPVVYSVCQVCELNEIEALWMCMLCGHIGCGRYKYGHANQHYQESGHQYAISVSSQQVWDYTADSYIHRLITNKADGKLVELHHERGEGMTHSGTDDTQNTYDNMKLDELVTEYNYLLSTQMEKQRTFYQQRIAALDKAQSEQLNSLNQEYEGAHQ